MIDEQKLRELAAAATPGPWTRRHIGRNQWGTEVWTMDNGDIGHSEIAETYTKENAMLIESANPASIIALLDELETLRKQKSDLQEFSKLACRALDDCSRVLTTIDGESMHEQDQIDELNTRVTNLAVQALVLNGLIHRGQLEETP